MLAYYEGKKSVAELDALINGLTAYSHKNISMGKRHNDTEGKIKHFQIHHPEYFVVFTDTSQGMVRAKYKILFSDNAFILIKNKPYFDP